MDPDIPLHCPHCYRVIRPLNQAEVDADIAKRKADMDFKLRVAEAETAFLFGDRVAFDRLLLRELREKIDLPPVQPEGPPPWQGEG